MAREIQFAAIVTLLLSASASGKSIELKVSACGHDRVAAPAFFQLPKSLHKTSCFVLTELESGSAVPVQLVPGKPPQIAWIVRDLPTGQTRTYRLEEAEAPTPVAPNVACSDDGTRLTLSIGDQPVVSYNQGLLPAPDGIDPVFAKNGHIHPMRTPSGRLVTDDFPPDHAHQHGIFFAWVNTTFEGRPVDFWNQAKKLGSVEHVRTLETVSGPVFGQFRVKLRHSDLTAPGGPKPVLEEIWTIRVYNVADPFLVDLKSEQRCVADTPLVVNEYHYGGMGLRGAREWYEQEGSGFLTSRGKAREDGNHTRARWVIAHGRSEGQPTAVAVLSHPDNFRAPQYVRLHPSKPYFCFAPMVMGTFEIAPGKPFVSQYRYATYDGEPDAELADRLWQDLAEPPAVRTVVK
jgi:methane monooxygenase PmoA-like